MVKKTEKFYGKREKILLADPDTSCCFLVSEILSKYRIETVSTGNGYEAIRLLGENPSIHCLITEIRVQQLDGFGILKVARKINPSLTVIVLTAYVYENIKQKCLKAGFNDYISKPIDIQYFVEMVKKYVYISSGSRH